MRFMGLDIGTVRIGVALSDETGTIASPLCALLAKQGFSRVLEELREICEAESVGTLVVGMPLSLGGEAKGESARRAKSLGDRLAEALGIDVVYVDERFTTSEANRMLVGADVRRNQRKKVVDKVAASLLLQSYLDARQERDR
jgi:putative Holliday junction resolvase